MSEITEQYETTWASDDENLLRVAVDAVAREGVAASSVVRVEWAGRVSYAVRLSSTKEPLGAPPKGVRVEQIPAAGVFMQGPRKPTPLEWMDRLPPDRQESLMEALSRTSQGRLLTIRMAAAKEIDPTSEQVRGAVAGLREAGVLTEEEATSLLAP